MGVPPSLEGPGLSSGFWTEGCICMAGTVEADMMTRGILPEFVSPLLHEGKWSIGWPSTPGPV